ncbi:hypothetical protein [Micromonospora sp. CPCC 206061]|uniref:hypothetical protein n=1 Tax=Micromonospora sp. CPCC 206061 TaxID=3122410 RepID=UPI002FF0ECA1
MLSRLEARRGSRNQLMLRTRPAVVTAIMAIMAIVAGAVGVTVPVASAAASPTDARAAVAEIEPAAVVEARARGTLVEQRHLEELVAQGLSLEQAAAQVLTEQTQAADLSRRRIMELAAQGMTPQEIADATPGLFLAATAPDDPGPTSTNGSLELHHLTRYYYTDCSCDHLVAHWTQLNDLESGKDLVGIRVEESTQMLGGRITHCDTGANPDKCYVDDVDYEDPNGVAHDFSSENGERGTISMSVKQYASDGPGPCQMFAHYRHAWESVSISGVSITTDNVTVNWSFSDNEWHRSKAGPGVAC